MLLCALLCQLKSLQKARHCTDAYFKGLVKAESSIVSGHFYFALIGQKLRLILDRLKELVNTKYRP